MEMSKGPFGSEVRDLNRPPRSRNKGFDLNFSPPRAGERACILYSVPYALAAAVNDIQSVVGSPIGPKTTLNTLRLHTSPSGYAVVLPVPGPGFRGQFWTGFGRKPSANGASF